MPFVARVRRVAAPRDRALQVALLVAVLTVWEALGRRTSDLTFAPPTAVVSAAREMTASGELQEAVVASLTALALGLSLAAGVGIGLGYAMGWWRALGRALDPLVTVLYVTPVAALVPAMIIWLGLGLTSRVVIIFLFGVFEILLNAYAGVRNVDQTIIDVARNFGAKRRDLVRKVVLPATLPFLFVGVRMGASRAIKGMVVAEMIFAVTGLGYLIVRNAASFRMDRVFVAVIAIALIGVTTTALIQTVERRVMRWRD
jgi:ABC-type nitrate/sulfonate/bicarbonate transport system permease component